MLKEKEIYTEAHNGINFSASTKERLSEMIVESIFERSVFMRESGFGRSSY